MILTPSLVALAIGACALHPTPPPAVYVDQGERLVAEGYVVGTVDAVPAEAVDGICRSMNGGRDPVGFPGQRYGACTRLDISALPIIVTIVIPAEGREGALCHELGHVGGWPSNHPRS